MKGTLGLETHLEAAFQSYFAGNSSAALNDILQTTADLTNLASCNLAFVDYLSHYTKANATPCANAMLMVQMQEATILGEWSNMISVTTPDLFLPWAKLLSSDITQDQLLIAQAIIACSF